MKYQLSRGVTIERVDGQSIMITEAGDAAVLNETAGYILDHLLNGEKIDTIVQSTLQNYEVEYSVVTKDIEALLLALKNKGLIISIT